MVRVQPGELRGTCKAASDEGAREAPSFRAELLLRCDFRCFGTSIAASIFESGAVSYPTILWVPIVGAVLHLRGVHVTVTGWHVLSPNQVKMS